MFTGVLTDVQAYFNNIGDAEAGLLQSIFVVGFSITAPIFGYFGDRYNRKWLMLAGIGLWSVVTLAGSFVPGNVSNGLLCHVMILSFFSLENNLPFFY